MIWFLLSAAITIAAFDWSGGGGSRRYWAATIAALAAFGAALTIPGPGPAGECGPAAGLACRAGFVIFAGLFLLSSLSMGLGAVFRRLSAASFAILGLSDLTLLLAVWTHVGESSVWSLPEARNWHEASGWGAIAAMLRLAAPLAARRHGPPESGETAGAGDRLIDRIVKPRGSPVRGGVSDAVLLSVGWWQGAFLAWWVGAGGAAVLASAGLALWPAAAFLGRSRPASLGAAGGLVALAAAAGVPAAGLAAVGLGGVALALGGHVVGVFLLAVLPLSVLTLAELPFGVQVLGPPASQGDTRAGFWFALAVIFPAAWAFVGSSLPLPAPVPGRRAPGATALPGATLASIAALGAALAGGLEPGSAGWALAGGTAAVMASAKISGTPLGRRPLAAGAPGLEAGPPPEPDGSPHPPRRPMAAESAGTLVGWAVLSLALIVFGRLVWTGLRTGFL